MGLVDQLLERFSRKTAVLVGITGVIADFAAPLGDCSLIMLVLSILGCLIIGGYWIGVVKKRLQNEAKEKAMSEKDSEALIDNNLWGKSFNVSIVASVIFAGLFSTQVFAGSEDNGLIATYIPYIEKIQNSLFRIEKNTQEISNKLDSIDEGISRLDKRYSIEDLQKLATQEMWQEVVDHLGDIDPLKRDQSWQDLLEKSAVSHITTLDLSGTYDEKYQQLEYITKNFPTIKRSSEFLKLRATVGLKILETCMRGRKLDCVEIYLRFVKWDSKDKDFAFKAGRRVTYHYNHRGALPFFILALEGTTNHEYCAHERVKSAVKNGIDGSDRYETTRQAKRIVNELCPTAFAIATN